MTALGGTWGGTHPHTAGNKPGNKRLQFGYKTAGRVDGGEKYGILTTVKTKTRFCEKIFLEETNMKKIVALVLSLVMALSLCTVAFAADYPYSVFYKENDGDADGHAKFVEQTDKYLPHYLCDDGAIMVEVSDDSYDYVIAVDGKDVNVKYVGKDKTAIEAYKAEAVAKHSFVGCGDNEDQIPADCYQLAIDDSYVIKTDAKAWAAGLTAVTVDGKYENVFYAKTASVFTASWQGKGADVVPASHVLMLVEKNIEYKTSTDGKIVKNVNEYKCYFCNKTFYGSEYDYSTPETAVEYDKAYAQNLVKQGYVAIGATTELATVPYIWTNDAGSKTTTEGVNSAKTFDAGVAMYVGMSLLSVAGGAVVIGKKKEF